MRGDRYQIALIVLGILVTCLFGYFLLLEMFPEYRIYQDDYVKLEEFRSTYLGEPTPLFVKGVKQIVFEREDKGPAFVERCISCHVAMQLPHFSPTKIVHDENGKIKRSPDGTPLQEPNENYIWSRLDHKIAQLQQENPEEAKRLAALKVASVGDHPYQVEKVLVMHPLIGKETRSFEFHPIEEYGCVSCHSGNGRGLTTEKAHGPVFDGEYGIEQMGYVPQFIEHDPLNDPLFSRIFNHKPDDSLLFQTTPILVGNLIQASCVQCHSSQTQSEISAFTVNYHQGEQLFLSQACYACHKIAGTARGGVGPELTRAGQSYPWYLKESIVWPQADLRTSTMPNFKLDHVELEDLMTYLLSQKGANKSISEISYKRLIKEWENGQKSQVEMPVLPSDVHDLNHSMTIFATQGCASCHRLEGFVSDVGYSIEKDKENQSSFNALYQEKQWFRNLFPEEALGSFIAKTVTSHMTEIDLHIVDGVRKNSLIEEIEKNYPGTIESFYSNFHFASRSKNAEYQQDPLKLKEWKDRIHRILMMYIQEYGLGRLIGPRPNWSGVYRSDEWLMEHFKNPTGHVPKSLMPVFPFDPSKFTALTFMLDVLGKQNRDAVRKIWQEVGFDPELAYQIHCSQCHGEYLQGNGPVAPWIYPIPKNLRNAEFMRNLTKENAVISIMHGVKGTSMPPWGETPKDKENEDGIPVLSHENISKIVDWLYQSLPGGAVIRSSEDVPKWQYLAKDVLNELHREGGELKAGQPQETVENVFDVSPNPILGGERDVYYIKNKFYTPENLEKGAKFFAVNCAYCHGADADGSGMRASVMLDAKPRMLINLDWLNTRDDLRLLRSIKYGVKGTAMTPWGDFTSSIQRMQLVMFIRHLSFDKERREVFAESLYRIFEPQIANVEKQRIAFYPELVKRQDEYESIKRKRQNPSISDEEAISLYKQELELKGSVKKLKEKDKGLTEEKRQINEEQTKMLNLGNAFLSSNVDDDLWLTFLQFVELKEGLSKIQKNDTSEQRKTLADQINRMLDTKIDHDKKKLSLVLGKLPSQELELELQSINQEITTYHKLKEKFKNGTN